MHHCDVWARRALALAAGVVWSVAPCARAQDSVDVKALQTQVTDLQQRLAGLEATAPKAPGALRLIDSSVDVLLAAGGSSEDNEGIEQLQGGGHDPKRRGFTLQQAELSFAGVVDPYFSGEAHIVLLEDAIELEEAFVTSTALPGGLQVKAGYYLTEFGRINPTHPHTWPWLDQPVIASRLLGEDGLRAAGARVGWLLPTPWYSQVLLGVQNADNETAVSFLGEGHHHGEEEGEEAEAAHAEAGDEHAEEAHAEGEHEGEEEEHVHDLGVEETIGGQPAPGRDINGLDDYLYSARWENSGDLSEETTALLGVSALYGPNATGEDGETFIYGADLTLKWRAAGNQRGYPFVTWQTEIMKRDFDAAAVSIPHEDEVHEFAAASLEDWGLYSQLLWGFAPGWEAGLRIEYATGSDDGLEERDEDAARSDRVRISPLVAWRPSEFSRLRLQYNYDDADFLADGEAHTVWAGVEFLYGMHPAHTY